MAPRTSPRRPTAASPADDLRGAPTGAPTAATARPPVGIAEIAPWYAVAVGFAALALLATGAGVWAAAGSAAGLLAAGAAARLVALRNSQHTVRNCA